jgi:hypothetical protein
METNKNGELFLLWNTSIPRLQKFDTIGNSLWGLGKLLTIDTAEVFGNLGYRSSLLVDDNGNCFVIWNDSRRYEYPDSKIESDAMIQGFTSSGNYIFGDSGLYLGKKEYPSTASFIGIYNDSLIYVQIAYKDTVFQLTPHIFFQIIDKTGKTKYAPGGKKILHETNITRAAITKQSDFYLIDGTGNIIKCNADANILWKNKSYSGTRIETIVFNDGGILVCGPSRPSDTLGNYYLSMNSFTTNGSLLIPDTGKYIADNIISRGKLHCLPSDNETVIIGYSSPDNWSYLLKVQRNGTIVWGENNTLKFGYLKDDDYGKSIVSNGTNGVIVIANDTNYATVTSRCVSNNIGANGNYIWNNKNVNVTTRSEAVIYEPVMSVSDRKGGVIVAWTERGSETIPGTYIQRVNYQGNLGNLTSVASDKSSNANLLLTISELFPNPTNGEISIIVNLLRPSKINITIFNSLGQKIKNLYHQELNSGEYTIRWDFKNEINNTISSGIYFLQIKTNGYSTFKKIIFTK